MKTQSIYYKGTEINKVYFTEIADRLSDKGVNQDVIINVLNTICNDDDYAYVSNGFVNGLKADENEQGEWHHYFTKCADGSFEANKLQFN